MSYLSFRALNIKSRAGSAFILALWVMILLSLLSFSVAFKTRLATKLNGWSLLTQQHNYHLLSAVNLARFMILQDEAPKVDSKSEAWYGHLEASLVPVDQDLLTSYDIHITDEESKINLNKASSSFIKSFLDVLETKGIELSGNPSDIARDILSWRGDVSYRGQSKLGRPFKKAPFETLTELQLLGLSPEDEKKLKPFVTIYSHSRQTQGKINLNTVHPYVLEGLIRSLNGGDFVKSRLLSAIEGFRDSSFPSQPNQVFGIRHLKIQSFINLLKLPNSRAMHRITAQLLSQVTVNSQFFTVSVTPISNERLTSLEVVMGPATFNPVTQERAKSGALSSVGIKVVTALEVHAWREVSPYLLRDGVVI